jgi:hypothetical protein
MKHDSRDTNRKRLQMLIRNRRSAETFGTNGVKNVPLSTLRNPTKAPQAASVGSNLSIEKLEQAEEERREDQFTSAQIIGDCVGTALLVIGAFAVATFATLIAR